MNPNYCDTVTIYNRLKAADSPDKKEHWKKQCWSDAAITAR